MARDDTDVNGKKQGPWKPERRARFNIQKFADACDLVNELSKKIQADGYEVEIVVYESRRITQRVRRDVTAYNLPKELKRVRFVD